MAGKTVICASLAFLNSAFCQYYLVRVAGTVDTNIGLCLQQFRRRTGCALRGSVHTGEAVRIAELAPSKEALCVVCIKSILSSWAACAALINHHVFELSGGGIVIARQALSTIGSVTGSAFWVASVAIGFLSICAEIA